MPVRFFQEEIKFIPKQKTKLKKWITTIITREHSSPGEINYIFCSDYYLYQINKDFLNHDYFTDIITFDHSDDSKELTGDIYISIDRVKENAKANSASFDEELYRVMIHGVLHLLGYTDNSDEEKKKMREKEDACLSLYTK